MVTVREAVPADAAAICDLHVASIREFGPAAYSPEQVAAWASDKRPENYPVADPAARLVVAEVDGSLAGFGQLDVEDAEVGAVYVHPDYARRGVGTALLDAVEAHARECGIDELSLLASRNAVPFYEAMGYEPRGGVTKALRGVEFPCLVMAKPFR